MSGESDDWLGSRNEGVRERKLIAKDRGLFATCLRERRETDFSEMFQKCPAYLVAGSSCLTLVRDPSEQGSQSPLGIQIPLDVGGTACVAPVRDPGGHSLLFPPRGGGGCSTTTGPRCLCACLTQGAGQTPRAAAGGHCTGFPARPSELYPTRAGCAEPCGSLCRRRRKSQEWVTQSAA